MRRTNTTAELVTRKGRCKNVKISDIKVEATHRLGKEDKKFKALEKSIKANGIINPIIVKNNEDGSYTIIDGKRRYEAALGLGYKKLQVVRYEDIRDTEALMSLVVNTNQKALTPIELGIAYKKLIDRGLYSTNRELAKALGVSESTVGTKIKNLELDKRIIEKLLEDNSITDQKVLKALRNIEKTDENGVSEKQYELFESIVNQNLNRKDSLELIKLGVEVHTVIDETHQFLTEEIKEQLEISVNIEGLDEDGVNEIQALIERIKEIQQTAQVATAA